MFSNGYDYVIYKDYTDDGVIGLNGKQYLLDDRNNVMGFKSYADAEQFLDMNGVDYKNNEGMQIVKCRCHSMPIPEEESCLCEIGVPEEDTRAFNN